MYDILMFYFFQGLLSHVVDIFNIFRVVCINHCFLDLVTHEKQVL